MIGIGFRCQDLFEIIEVVLPFSYGFLLVRLDTERCRPKILPRHFATSQSQALHHLRNCRRLHSAILTKHLAYNSEPGETNLTTIL